MHTTIIVPTTAHDSEMLADCLNGIAEHAPANTHLCLVCNSDSDADIEKAQQLEQSCRRILRSVTSVYIPQRVGYVHACNIGFNTICPQPGDWIIVLNDDIQLAGDVVGPLTYPLYKESIVQTGASIKRVGKNGFWGDESDKWLFAEGWCFAVKVNAALVADGLFDPAYAPGYCEDMDLSIRLQAMGGQIAAVNVPITHLRSRTFGHEREPFWTDNRKRLVEKWGLDR